MAVVAEIVALKFKFEVHALPAQDHNHPVRYRNVWIRELK
jgi:hypothetical protein